MGNAKIVSKDFLIQNFNFEKRSQKVLKTFWHDFLVYTPINNNYFECKNYYYYYFKFWTLCEVRIWKRSGRLSTVENQKNFTKC